MTRRYRNNLSKEYFDILIKPNFLPRLIYRLLLIDVHCILVDRGQSRYMLVMQNQTCIGFPHKSSSPLNHVKGSLNVVAFLMELSQDLETADLDLPISSRRCPYAKLQQTFFGKIQLWEVDAGCKRGLS